MPSGTAHAEGITKKINVFLVSGIHNRRKINIATEMTMAVEFKNLIFDKLYILNIDQYLLQKH